MSDLSMMNRDEVLRRFRQLLNEDYGIYFKDEKLYSLRNKLNRRVQQLSLDNLSEYEEYLTKNPDEINNLVNEVSINKSEFFRELQHWSFLKENIFPDWKRRRTTVKIWSAACSTGEEPYTISMLFEDHGIKPYKILATDIARKVLQHTDRGIYSEEELRGVYEYNPNFIMKYFNREKDNTHRVKQELRNQLTLRNFNLKNDQYPYEDSFDLVLCRNVLIYFGQELVEYVANQMYEVLKPGGYLFTGHTESLQNTDHNLIQRQPGVYRKPQ